jgi:hypothetical protein
MNATRPRPVEDYLKELDRSLAGLPSARRKEIVADIEEHIDLQLSELGPAPSDGQVRDLLNRVGHPDELAADARDRFEVPAPQPRWTDYLALVLLPIGGLLVPLVGWLAGVVLLWSSRVWSNRDKLLGTLIVPGGLLLPASLMVAAIEPADSNDTSALVWVGLIVGLAGPCIMVPYLALKLSRARHS